MSFLRCDSVVLYLGRKVLLTLLTYLFLFQIHGRGKVLFHSTKCLCNKKVEVSRFERHDNKTINPVCSHGSKKTLEKQTEF